MPAVYKDQTQLLISPHVKTRVQALAVVRDESQANVLRVALEGGGLQGLEQAHAGILSELRETFGYMGVDFGKAVETMIGTKPRIRFGDLFDEAGRPHARFPGVIR